MAANKTFQVSRKQQYKRDKPRSPLASLDGKSVRERSLTKQSSTDDLRRISHEHKPVSQKRQYLALSEQENIVHSEKNSPLVLLVQAAELTDSGNVSASPDVLAGKPENRDLSKVLNRTLSPIGTPERFKKLMPHIQSESPVPTLKDALALINSDLSHISNSPQNTSSSCSFSDSLESKSGIHGNGSKTNVLKLFPDSPELSESSEPRLTFFVSKKVVVTEAVVSQEEAVETVKKASFTSATVTKGKAPVEANLLSGRKIKKSRRRLLEKTLDLSDGSSQSESGPGTPSLPVIDLDTEVKEQPTSDTPSSLPDDGFRTLKFRSSSPTSNLGCSATPITLLVTSPLSMAPSSSLFSCNSPLPTVPATFAFTSPSSLHPPALPPLSISSSPRVFEQAPPVSASLSTEEELFPVHVAVNNKKRKSEEYLKVDAKVVDDVKTDRVKRSRVVAAKTESTRSVSARSVSQRHQVRAAGGPI